MSTQKTEIFTLKDSMFLRGIAIIMVIFSHYIPWSVEQLPFPLLQQFATKLGVYGVDIFFLLSGYALVKTTAGKSINLQFVWKRLKNMYLPYLVIVGLIELYAGGFQSFRSVYRYLLGLDFWFIFNILVFYLVFMLLWKIGHFKLTLLTLFIVSFSFFLYSKGNLDFWFVSNGTFLLGVFLGTYEKKLCPMIVRQPYLKLLVLTVLMFVFTTLGLQNPPLLNDSVAIWMQILATIIFSLWVTQFVVLLRWHGCIFSFLGKISIYIYLLHTFIYYQCINFFGLDNPYLFFIILVVTIAISFLIYIILQFFFQLPALLKNGFAKEKI